MKFSIKSMMFATLACALVAWACAPGAHFVYYQWKNASLQQTLIEKGVNPHSDKASMTVKREYDSNGLVVRTSYK